MTKRVGEFGENDGKKQKLNDDLWGDDLNVEDIDDCLELASQIIEKDEFTCTQKNNVTILPSYNSFKKPVHTTSTQLNGTQRNFNGNVYPRSTFQTPYVNGVTYSQKVDLDSSGETVKKKVKTLEEECVTKNGEILYLRKQLKQVKSDLENEKIQRESEWMEKLTLAQKEIDVVKAELSFKDLKVANLKSQLIELTKLRNGRTNLIQNVVEPATSSRSPTLGLNDKHLYVDATPVPVYPLMSVIPPEFFETPESEQYDLSVFYNKLSKGVQNVQYIGGNEIVKTFKKISLGRSLSIACVNVDVHFLMKCQSFQIDSEICYQSINKIIHVSKYVLQSFYDYLEVLEQNLQSGTIRQLDKAYLEHKSSQSDEHISVFYSKKWCSDEIGIRARQMVGLLAEIVPYSTYLQDYLLHQKPLSLRDEGDLINITGYERIHHEYMYLVLIVIKSIGKLRKSESCVGLLCATTTLLTRICSTKSFTSCYPSLILNLIKEIVFARPTKVVVKLLTELLKVASMNCQLVEQLCERPEKRSSITSGSEGISYFSQDSCLLQIFCILYVDTMNENVIDINLNVYGFIMNILSVKPKWMHYEENNYCDCVQKIISLSIQTVHRSVEEFKMVYYRDKPLCGNLNVHKELLKCGAKVLHSLHFKAADLMCKYETDYNKLKFIIKSLEEFKSELDFTDRDVVSLSVLWGLDELVELNNDKFQKVSLWN